MSVQVLSLASGAVPQNATAIYTSTGITTIVKAIRLANKDTVPRTVNLYINRSTNPDSGTDRRISPKDMSIPAGGLAIDDTEITMTAGDILKADTSGVASVNIDYYISGIQR
jgi:hypothetical protein